MTNPRSRLLTNGIKLAGLTSAALAILTLCAGMAANTAVAKDEQQPRQTTQASRLTKEIRLRRQHGHNPSAHIAGAWSVQLTASATSLWPEQTTTLTATVNQKVSPPYSIGIWNSTTNTWERTCANATICTATFTEPTAQTDQLFAEVMDGSTEVADASLDVQFKSVGAISLSASPTTVYIGGLLQPGQSYSSTLTATTTTDVGPTPFYTEIYDVTTGTRVAVCGSGTTCSLSVSEVSPTTQEYVAYVSDYSSALPPSGIQATSADSYVTWTATGWTISLTAPRSTEGGETVTATANQNVGPTPYYIEIFDELTGRMIGDCASGTTCSISYAPSGAGSELVAFVSPSSTALPPAGAVASSNVVSSELIIP